MQERATDIGLYKAGGTSSSHSAVSSRDLGWPSKVGSRILAYFGIDTVSSAHRSQVEPTRRPPLRDTFFEDACIPPSFIFVAQMKPVF